MGRLVGRVLGRTGYSLTRSSELYALSHKSADVIGEIEGAFSEIIFPGLRVETSSLPLLARLLGTSVSEALYMVHFLHESLAVNGDVCEFGVAQGATSALLANEMRSSDRTLWLFDSFQGLPKPGEKDLLINDIFNLGSMEKYEGTMRCGMKQVTDRLSEIEFPADRVRIVPGFVQETVKAANLPPSVCFAYVDFDFYEGTAAVLRFLQSHLTFGGCVVVDDYGFFSSGVATAVEEFLDLFPGEYERVLPYSFAGRFCILHRKPKMSL